MEAFLFFVFFYSFSFFSFFFSSYFFNLDSFSFILFSRVLLYSLVVLEFTFFKSLSFLSFSSILLLDFLRPGILKGLATPLVLLPIPVYFYYTGCFYSYSYFSVSCSYSSSLNWDNFLDLEETIFSSFLSVYFPKKKIKLFKNNEWFFNLIKFILLNLIFVYFF